MVVVRVFSLISNKLLYGVLRLIFFNLERDVRQDCPLSGTLFVLGIEILALAIKQNSKIEGIRVGAREMKITQYADDATVFLKNP